MKHSIVHRSLIASGLFAALPAFAGTSVGTGFDYAVGDYGTGTNTTTLTIPLIVKYEDGPITLKATLPYVRSEGVSSGAREFDDRGGGGGGGDDDPRPVGGGKVRQNGIGDLVGSAFVNVWNSQSGHGLDLGLKVKLATADSKNFLITTGENDFSVQADYFMPVNVVANGTAFFTFGHTIKGDPPGTDYRNPNYFAVGLSQRVSETGTWGVAYDYREKLLPTSDPVSEASLFYSYRYNQDWKIQTYGVMGIASDASPDFGIGATIFHAY